MEQLLQKYWEGLTTIEEEKKLIDYFNSQEVAPEFEIYKSFFRGLNHKDEVGVKFDAFAKVNQLKATSFSFRSKKLLAAASIALIAALGTAYMNNSAKSNLGSFDNPEEAFNATVNALKLVGTQMNKGKNNLKHFKQIELKQKQVFSLAN